jgi:hypothetical protein
MSAEEWAEYYKGKTDPFPSWFGSINVAGLYRRLYHDGGGTILQFELSRDALMFASRMKRVHPNASPKQILEALRFATGIGMTCKQRAAYIGKLEIEYECPLTIISPGTRRASRDVAFGGRPRGDLEFV